MQTMASLSNRIRRLRARLSAPLHRPPAGLKLTFVEPSYWIADTLSSGSTMLDLGLGNNADFSMAMIRRFGVVSHGYDPTRKHAGALQELADRSGGRFVFHARAIGSQPGSATFHESQQNVSGSMMAGHYNVRHDAVSSYDVEVITLDAALSSLPGGRADLVKMDVEGAEYEVLDATPDDVLDRADQWCIEFHHETVDGVTVADTRRQVERFRRLGFRAYTRNGSEYLFYRVPERARY